MYSKKQDESMNGIAGMFFVFALAVSALMVFSIPYLVRFGAFLGNLIVKLVMRIFSKKA
jgi:hypothetical protein